MDSSYIHYLIEAVGVVMWYLIRDSQTQTQKRLDEHRSDLKALQDSKMDKVDFREFRIEVKEQLDRIYNSVERLRNEKN
jgi:hypothetical protein